MTQATLFDSRTCILGEGPLWHPLHKQYYWFDIMGKKLLTLGADGPKEWSFDEHVSAAGWVSENELLIASQTALFLFDLNTGKTVRKLCDLEADDATTRSNDGRADTYGGFWIGTMGINAETNAGAIYRYYKGELRCLYSDISISNSICFSPDGAYAYYSDTAEKTIRRQKLNPKDGWPTGSSELWLDLSKEGINPDGSVIDMRGYLWNAQWGLNRIACYNPDGVLLETVACPEASQTSCPAFGGEGLTDLLITTARVGLSAEILEKEPMAGATFLAKDVAKGQQENQVIL
ncbi:SMP-30/gluconolactonase/LRE family protein [Falsihalocynthiibacter sp. S25ZX9]|uniref:SMP-30/gluconolactonase/LRE family protein n=1 Tax=Falsihalocynthiibacter sp. S25ZX9 TaxID=3240870 RepID=UPI003510BF66